MPDSAQLRIIVLGYLVRGPLGGLAWHHLQYVLGLSRLGHEVYFLEDSGDYPECYDPSRHLVDTDPSYGIEFAAKAFDRLHLGSCWAYHDAHSQQWHGPRGEDIRQLCQHADLVLNVSGMNPLRPWVRDIPFRVLIDTDPVFTQIRNLQDPQTRSEAKQHTHFLTFGENFGSPACTIPDDGFPWLPTRQPVVLESWPVSPPSIDAALTTVMQWDSYVVREHEGVEYGMKSTSFLPFLDLPRRCSQVLELAIGTQSAPRYQLRKRGWRIQDPLEVTRDPWTYQRYIQSSKGEFTVAKHGYVVSHSGWFSERSAAYLATGRPVVTQDTGFTDYLPAEIGLRAFSTVNEAQAAIEDVALHYDAHCDAARTLAEDYFASSRVLTRLLERVQQYSPKALSDR